MSEREFDRRIILEEANERVIMVFDDRNEIQKSWSVMRPERDIQENVEQPILDENSK